ASLRLALAYLTIELALRERDAHRIAVRDRCGIAQHACAIRVPADSVAAAEHRERAERLQPAGRVAQPRIGAMLRPRRGGFQVSVAADQTGADPRETPPKVERLELTPQLPDASIARSHDFADGAD